MSLKFVDRNGKDYILFGVEIMDFEDRRNMKITDKNTEIEILEPEGKRQFLSFGQSGTVYLGGNIRHNGNELCLVRE